MCFCFTCCCLDCSDALRRAIGSQKLTKVYYFILICIFVIPTIIIFFYLNKWDLFINFFSKWINCPNNSSLECIGSSAIFRISASLFILFFLLFLIMLCRSTCSMVINQGCFFIKYCFVIALFIASLFISNNIFQIYMQFSKYISIIFLILQSIILIDLFYLFGIGWAAKYSSGQTQYGCFLITWTIIIQIGAIALNIISYIIFPPQQCGSTLFINIITSIIIVVLPCLQIFNFNPQNSLLTSALVSLFISYLSFISQFSIQYCQRLTINPIITDICVSTLFFVITLYGSIVGGSGQVKVTSTRNLNRQMGLDGQMKTKQQLQKAAQNKRTQNQIQSQVDEQDDDPNLKKYTKQWRWVKWHAYLCLACVYIGMLITNWASVSLIQGTLSPSLFSFWIRVSQAWFTTLLYIWTLIAPKIFPQRDFTVV